MVMCGGRPKKANEDTTPNPVEMIQAGMDISSRRMEIRGYVGEAMASFIIRGLHVLSNISTEPIHIYFGSGGGEVYEGFAIYDAIRECPCEVHIHASGQIFSMGFIIYLAGDKRYASPLTTFMIHTPRGPIDGNVKNKEIQVVEEKRLSGLFLEILAARTKKPKNWWYRSITFVDKYFDLAEAKDAGIVNEFKKLTVPVKKIKRVFKRK